MNGYLNETTCKEIYAQFFPQASDSSLYARHVYRALFSRNNILTNLNNNNNILVTNANDQMLMTEEDEEDDSLIPTRLIDNIGQRTPSPQPGSRQFLRQQANKKVPINQESSGEELHQNKSRLRSQSTTGFKSFVSPSVQLPNVQLQQQTVASNTPGLLSKRRAHSLAKQTLESSSPSNYLDNYSSSRNSNTKDEVYFDYPLKRSSRNASSANLSYCCRETIPEKISFVEYAISLSALLKGSLEEKLAWTFQLYDISGDGKLTVDELIEISRAVYGLLGGCLSQLITIDHN